MLALRSKVPFRRGSPPSQFAVNHGHPSASGLCNYWLFTIQKGQNGRVVDLVGNSDLKLSGTSVELSFISEGLQTSAGIADATLYTPAIPTRNFATTDMWSADTLFRFDATDGFGAVITQNNGNGIYTRTGNKLSLWIGSDQLSPTVLLAGQWYHICLTADGSATGYKLYINGLIDITGASRFPATWAPTSFFNDNSSETFRGVMVFARLWGRMLSATEVLNLYTEPWMLTAKNSTGSPATTGSVGAGGTDFGGVFGGGFGGGGSIVTIAGGAD